MRRTQAEELTELFGMQTCVYMKGTRMISPYKLLNSIVVDFENDSEAEEIMALAKEVVDNFYTDLNASVAVSATYKVPFLLMSFDKLTFGNPPDVGDAHVTASQTGVISRVISFSGGLSAESALAAFSLNQDEMEAALMLTLINLRHIEVEGLSFDTQMALDMSVDRLRAMLTYALLGAY